MSDHKLTQLLPSPDIALGKNPHWGDVDDDGPVEHAYERACNKACKALAKRYSEFGAGWYRRVFDGGSVVYKVGDLDAQKNELKAFRKPKKVDGLKVAPCRMVYHSKGAPILIMQTVLPATVDDKDLPHWARKIDSFQVGKDPDGQWVIFDAGNLLMGTPYTAADSRECHNFQHHQTPELFATVV